MPRWPCPLPSASLRRTPHPTPPHPPSQGHICRSAQHAGLVLPQARIQLTADERARLLRHWNLCSKRVAQAEVSRHRWGQVLRRELRRAAGAGAAAAPAGQAERPPAAAGGPPGAPGGAPAGGAATGNATAPAAECEGSGLGIDSLLGNGAVEGSDAACMGGEGSGMASVARSALSVSRLPPLFAGCRAAWLWGARRC
jgi:hypothetical protein